MSPPLAGQIALVAGATRGAGRGIACALGEAGATVYCTGRSVRGHPATEGRPETIEETAEMVTQRGGRGIHVQVDHTRPEQVETLFARVGDEQGHLDILVNDIWGGDALTEWAKPFWKQTLAKGLLMLERAIFAHIITSRYGVPLMLEAKRGLVVEITDGDEAVNRWYRGTIFYDLAKVSAMRLAFAMAHDLQDTHVTAVALTPGFLRSEAMLEHFGVTEDNWQDAVKKEPTFAESETPFFVGRAVVALASDPHVADKSGRALSAWGLAQEYGFRDVDGRKPNMGGRIEDDLDARWGDLVAAARSTFARAGLDPDADLDDDRDRVVLKGRLNPRQSPPRWYEWRVNFADLWMQKPEKVAAAFHKRFRRECDHRATTVVSAEI